VLRERAPAKLNLDLLVTKRRADGYHLLDSLVVFLDLGDELAFAPAPGIELATVGPMAAGLPPGEGNLVLAAARALAADAGVRAGAVITLDKRLPIAAGIGGGSADAAATLRGLCRLWRIDPDPERLAALALRLGADVPVCLAGRPARMRGVGERLDAWRGPGVLDLVLVNPRRPLPTASVFRALDLAACAPRAGPLDALARSRNDLQAPASALLPEIDEVLAALAAAPGCGLARMSGSGPTCFGLFPDAAAAGSAAAALAARHPGWWIVACRSLDPLPP
jgi:4-diphosphocytidyl-2-C-methyl-D-erythritol kinase